MAFRYEQNAYLSSNRFSLKVLPYATFNLAPVTTCHSDRRMARQPPATAVAHFRPQPHRLRDQIRFLAGDSRFVSFGTHALERMEERDITTLDALRVLRSGEIRGAIEAGKTPGEWKCKMVAGRRGSREIGVATVVLTSGRLFVKTVEWEDL